MRAEAVPVRVFGKCPARGAVVMAARVVVMQAPIPSLRNNDNCLIWADICASSRRMVTLSAPFRPAQGPNPPDGRRRWARRRSLAACFAIGAGEWSSVRRGERVTSCAARRFSRRTPARPLPARRRPGAVVVRVTRRVRGTERERASRRRSYRAVVTGEVWPASAWTIARSAPDSSALDTNERRRSCGVHAAMAAPRERRCNRFMSACGAHAGAGRDPVGARCEQRANLADVERTAGREPRPFHVLDRGDAVVILARHQSELMAKSRHLDLRTLSRYVRPGIEGVARLTAAHDRGRRHG